jgi:hypothetical protein
MCCRRRLPISVFVTVLPWRCLEQIIEHGIQLSRCFCFRHVELGCVKQLVMDNVMLGRHEPCLGIVEISITLLAWCGECPT